MALDLPSLRIAVTGSSGVGKTTLARALSERLGLPLLPDELPRKTAGSEIAQVLETLWRRRARAEEVPSFVADTCAIDFIASALHHAVEARGGAFTREAIASTDRYDAIFLLPCSALSSPCTGDPLLDLRYHLLLEALLCRHAGAHRVHRLPEDCTDRTEWALRRLEAARPRVKPGRGFVYLVGAGPGDPKLLTLRAVELLRQAEVIAHDELVPPAVLALAGPHAELVAVGRRHHGSSRHPLRLHPEVLVRAAAGQTVVRLKCGDPFIFGRGGEEAEELAQAGIPFEVVPGVSAALGAAASARIPLTHREHSSDVTFVTGHDLVCGRSSRSDWGRIAGGGTLVIYMASRALGSNLARLVELGRPASTPAAWIENATRPEEKVVVGTLCDLASKVEGVQSDGPALVIVGEVVAVREHLQAAAQTALSERTQRCSCATSRAAT